MFPKIDPNTALKICLPVQRSGLSGPKAALVQCSVKENDSRLARMDETKARLKPSGWLPVSFCRKRVR
ncbi:hypothetical protein TNCV_1319421 [Trichonephila clavipes]|nr:hypothetical protein TNCV_1319421 [Trichonephila clavipes]